jgi:hypothetical protein
MLVLSFVWVFYFVNYLWFQFFEIFNIKEPPVLAFWKTQNYKAIDWFHLFQKTHESMVLMKELAKNCGFWEGSFVIFYFLRMLVTYQNQLALAAENNSYGIKEPP